MLSSCLCLLFFLVPSARSEKIKVLKTSGELSNFDQTSGAHLIFPAHTGAKGVTLCLRFFSYQFYLKYQKLIDFAGVSVGAYSMMEPVDLFWEEVMDSSWRNDNTVGFVETDTLKTFPIWDLNVWNHLCISIDYESMHVFIILNGESVSEDIGYKHKERKKNLLAIMGTYRGNGNGYISSTFGEISDINMWNRSFTLNEMSDWTDCNMNDVGIIIDWANTELDSHGLHEVFVERAKMCEKKSEGLILVADRRFDFNSTIHFCENNLG